jgi:hypothetical protein
MQTSIVSVCGIGLKSALVIRDRFENELRVAYPISRQSVADV